MPVPTPKKGQKQNEYMSECMKFFDDEDSDMSRKQRLAICFDKWNKSKKKKANLKRRNNKKIEKSKNLVKELHKLQDVFNKKYHMGK